MLKVSAIPNYNNQTTFNGKFIKTPEMAKAIEAASETDLKNFGKTLQSMSKAGDNIEWSLSSTRIYSKILVSLKKFKKVKGGTDLTSSVTVTSGTGNTAYKDVLMKTNKILEKHYPGGKTVEASDADLVLFIEKLLTKK